MLSSLYIWLSSHQLSQLAFSPGHVARCENANVLVPFSKVLSVFFTAGWHGNTKWCHHRQLLFHCTIKREVDVKGRTAFSSQNSKSAGGGWGLKCNTHIKNGSMAIRLLKMKMADCNYNTIIIIIQYGEPHTDFLSFFLSFFLSLTECRFQLKPSYFLFSRPPVLSLLFPPLLLCLSSSGQGVVCGWCEITKAEEFTII